MNSKTLEQLAHHCLADCYGLEGRLERLPGENFNFRVTTEEGERYVLKMVDEHMPSDLVELEQSLFEHLDKAGFGLKMPHIIRNSKKKYETRIKIPSNDELRARLIEFIDGTPWEDLPDISRELLQDAGILLGRFNNALESFDHPAAHRDHRWDLAAAGQHRDKAELFEDADERELVAWAFDLWEQAAEVLPPDLPRIHPPAAVAAGRRGRLALRAAALSPAREPHLAPLP